MSQPSNWTTGRLLCIIPYNSWLVAGLKSQYYSSFTAFFCSQGKYYLEMLISYSVLKQKHETATSMHYSGHGGLQQTLAILQQT